MRALRRLEQVLGAKMLDKKDICVQDQVKRRSDNVCTRELDLHSAPKTHVRRPASRLNAQDVCTHQYQD